MTTTNPLLPTNASTFGWENAEGPTLTILDAIASTATYAGRRTDDFYQVQWSDCPAPTFVTIPAFNSYLAEGLLFPIS